jgi:hypothetical protein
LRLTFAGKIRSAPHFPAPSGRMARMDADSHQPALTRSKLRWCQFSLRTLLIFTALLAVVCGLIGKKIEQKRRERQAIATIEDAGGYIEFDYQTAARGGSDAAPFGPKWLRSMLGENFFSEAIAVHMVPTNDEGLASAKKALQALPKLKRLVICAPSLTDAGLANLSGLRQLETLEFLDIHRVTDAGLKHLRALSELRYLDLGGNFNKQAVAELRTALPNCKISD